MPNRRSRTNGNAQAIDPEVETRRILRGAKPKTLADLYRKAIDRGATLSLTGRDHVLVTLPNGERYVGPFTSSDRKSILAMVTGLRRKGLDLKEGA